MARIIRATPATTAGLNKAERLARLSSEKEAAQEPAPLNADWPIGGIGFPAADFSAVRSDDPNL